MTAPPRRAHAGSPLIGPPLGLRLRASVLGLSLLAYMGLEWLSFLHEMRGLPVTPWNPGIGVLFGMLILLGPRYGIVLLVAVLLAELLVLDTHLPLPLVLALAAIIAASYTAAAVTLRSLLQMDVRVDRLRDLLLLLACGALGAALVAALLGLLFTLTQEMATAEVQAAARQLFLGDLLGIAVLTPLTLRLRAMNLSSFIAVNPRHFPLELAGHLTALGTALWMVARSADSELDQFYVLFLPVVAVALRFGFDGACLALALVQFALVAILHAFGADILAFNEIQALMLVLITTGLVVGAEVSERRRIERRLRAIRDQEAQAARFNIVTGMASSLAHEINQPMTAARALARTAQVLIEAPQPDLPRASQNLTGVIAQIDHAGGVLRRMRDFLKRGTPQSSTLAVSDLLSETSLLARPEADALGIRLAIEADDRLSVRGDPVQIQQILLNLVRNAMESITEAKLPLPDRFVRIRAMAREAAGGAVFAVLDRGPGVPEHRREDLFQPLVTSKQEGLGLGLSISAMLAEAHGGRLWLHNGEPGQTEFRFFLPGPDPERP